MSTFPILEEAQDLLYTIILEMYLVININGTNAEFSSLSPAEIETFRMDKTYIARSFKRWSTPFDDYLISKLEITSSSNHASRTRMRPVVHILQIWRIMVTLMLSVDFSKGEIAWDSHVHELESIYDLAASFIDYSAISVPVCAVDFQQTLQKTLNPDNESEQLEHQSAPEHHRMPPISISAATHTYPFKHSLHDTERNATKTRPLIAPKPARTTKPTFSLSMGIIPPLYMVSTRCRDPVIRRKAINLLSTCKRGEGIWDSWLSFRIALRMLEIEETGARHHLVKMLSESGVAVPKPVRITDMHQIPKEARVVDLGTSFGPDRQGVLRYAKSGNGLGSGDVIEEFFEW